MTIGLNCGNNHSMKKVNIIRLSVATGVLVICAALALVKVGSPSVATTSTTQDQALVADLRYVGVVGKIEPNLRYTSDHITTTNTKDPDGTYEDSSNTIVIKSGLDKEGERRVVTHEYMHYIYRNVFTDRQRNIVNTAIAKQLASNSKVNNYVHSLYNQGYVEETFAIDCANTTDSLVPQDILDVCDLYVNKSKLMLK